MQRPLNLFPVLTDTKRETGGRGKGEERREVRDLVTLYFFTPYYIFHAHVHAPGPSDGAQGSQGSHRRSLAAGSGQEEGPREVACTFKPTCPGL
jgi:hypothetical protein